MKRFTVDRIEENKAVLECENGDFVTMELSSLPKNVGEGDVITFDKNSCFLDVKETEERSRRIKKMMEALFED